MFFSYSLFILFSIYLYRYARIRFKCFGCTTLAANNKYFDVDIKTTPTKQSKVRVMSTKEHSERFFLQKQNQRSPILLKNLSPIKSGRVFFNINTGSSVGRAPEKLNFNFNDQEDLTVEQIKACRSLGTFSLSGQIVWQTETKEVKVGSTTKKIREAKLLDITNRPIDFSIWERIL